MANLILALMLIIMCIVSFQAIRKSRAMPYIDEVMYRDTPRRGWSILPWLIGLILVIFALRFFLTA